MSTSHSPLLYTLLSLFLLTGCQKEEAAPPQTFAKTLGYIAPTFGYPYYNFVTDDSMNVIVAYDAGPPDDLANDPFFTSLKIKLEKLDPFGETVWERTFDTELETKVGGMTQTQDGGFLLTGAQTDGNDSPVERSYTPLLIRTDAEGSLLWLKSYPLFKDFYGKAIFEAADGNIYVQADSREASGWVMQLDSEGNLIRRIYGAQGTSIIRTDAGDFLCAGRGLLLMQADGNIRWNNSYVSNADEGVKFFEKVIAVEDGNFLAYGFLFFDQEESEDNTSDFLLAKIDEEGNLIWELVIDRIDRDIGRNICLLPNGNYMAVGTIQKGFEHQGELRAYIVTPDGEQIDTEQITSGSHPFIIPSAIYPIGDKHLGLLVTTSPDAYGSSYLTVRFRKLEQ